MSDNYEFEKSSRPQDIDDYSPYTDKQYNGFINDLNSGVYTNTSLSLVQFDLGQIYNSQKFTDTNDLFLVLPITMVAAFNASGTGIVAPVNG
jgi:DNA helicase IV